MPDDLPPSGSWAGYYLYGYGGPKHRMRLNLSFSVDGKIAGDGIDDIAPFVVDGQFDGASSHASWTKTYFGMHSVAYSGIYCQRAICGDWTLVGSSGGFWIWPRSAAQTEFAEEQEEIKQPVEMV